MHEHEGHKKRMRDRYRENGLDGFSEHEALELLLSYVFTRGDTNPLAHRLVERFGSFARVLEASPVELASVEGMGERSAAFVSMMLPLFRYYSMRKADATVLDTVQKLKDYCRGLFVGANEEIMYIVCLDARLKLINHVEVARGTVNGIVTSTKKVAEEAVRQMATGVVLVHNHPGGSMQASAEDIDFTYRCRKALDPLEIRLYDHIIVGKDCMSMRENGDLSF